MAWPSAVSMLCLSLLVSGCAAARVDLPDASSQRELIVRDIDNDQKGLPLFKRILDHRPAADGERFTIVRMRAGLPQQSFDIAIIGKDFDLHKPWEAFYSWTGRGFAWGMETAGRMTMSALQSSSGGNQKGLAAVVVAGTVVPVTIGTVTGFVVGIAEGVSSAVEESWKVLTSSQETIVTTTKYEHDGRGRLLLMRMYAADGVRELVRTEFHYNGDEMSPLRTVITNRVDGTVKTVR